MFYFLSNFALNPGLSSLHISVHDLADLTNTKAADSVWVTRLQSFTELLHSRCTVLNSFLWDLSFSIAGQKQAFLKLKDRSNSWFSKENIREFTLSWKIHCWNKNKIDQSSEQKFMRWYEHLYWRSNEEAPAMRFPIGGATVKSSNSYPLICIFSQALKNVSCQAWLSSANNSTMSARAIPSGAYWLRPQFVDPPSPLAPEKNPFF